MSNPTTVPQSLEEALQLLTTTNSHQLDTIGVMEEEEFMASAHHGLGRSLRNTWFLWWTPEGARQYPDAWPVEEPALVGYFNSLGITHADDRSGIILRSWHRQLNQRPLELDAQISHYKAYWAKHATS